MKVTLINTSDAGGGAPEACVRLLKALQMDGVDAKLLAQHKYTHNVHVQGVADTGIARVNSTLDFYLERLPFMFLHEKDKSVRFAFSTATVGQDVSKKKLVKEADIIHLHWTNSGFMSIHNLQQVIALNKPVVWTLHDMWAFTGGCHYSNTCQNFLKECGNCPMLQDSADNDISREGWLRKQAMYKAKNIVFVTCSNWLAGIARTSPLLKGFRIEAIPNPIDTTIYGPQNQAEVRKAWNIDTDAKILVFGAANIMHTRKGIAYLIEALHHLKADYPKQGTIEIVLFGKSIGFDMGKIPFKVHDMGVIVDQRKLAQIYNLADVFVLPSLEDNLPNMVMESLACGVPVVAFNTGGIPDMVEHEKNGYLAEYKSATDMAKGINYILTTPQLPGLKEAARAKVVKNFTNAVVSAKYKALYQSLLKK